MGVKTFGLSREGFVLALEVAVEELAGDAIEAIAVSVAFRAIRTSITSASSGVGDAIWRGKICRKPSVIKVSIIRIGANPASLVRSETKTFGCFNQRIDIAAVNAL